MNVKISDGTARLARSVDNVFFRTWLATYPNHENGITEEDIRYNFRNRKARLEKRRVYLDILPRNERFLVAKDANRVVGLCSIKKDEEKNELNAIYVLPEYQWKWIGNLLWKESLAFFDKNLPIILSVVRYNVATIAFYKKLGFAEHTGKFHSDGAHALKNGKSLPTVTMILENPPIMPRLP